VFLAPRTPTNCSLPGTHKPHEREVVAVAGTAKGADTVTVVRAVPSNRLFEMKVRAVLAKPWEW
jgi:hypothetical protein